MAGLAGWWPRRRTVPAAPPSAAPDPRWQALPPIQRTVGGIAATTDLDRFSTSLTTARNPGLVSSAGTLATEHADTLTILDIGAPPPQPPPRPVVASQPRSWQRSVHLPQRMVSAPDPVQRSEDSAAPVFADTAETTETPEAAETAEAPVTASAVPLPEGTSLTRAPDPGEHRELPVVAPLAPPFAEPVQHETPVATGDPVRPAQAATPVQRVADGAATPPSPPPPVPRTAAAETLSANGSLHSSGPGHRVVQRSTTVPAPAPPSPSPHVDTTRPVPEPPASPPDVIAVAQPDPPADTRDGHGPAITDGPTAPSIERDVQRAVASEAITWLAPDDPVRPIPARRPAPMDHHTGTTPAATVQRVSVQRVSVQRPTTPSALVDPAPERPTGATPPAARNRDVVAAQRVEHHEPPPVAEIPPLQRIAVAPAHEAVHSPPQPLGLHTQRPATPPETHHPAAPAGRTPATALPATTAPPVAQRATTPAPSTLAAATRSVPARPGTPTPPTAHPHEVVPEVQRSVTPIAPDSAPGPAPHMRVVLPPLRAPERPESSDDPAPLPVQQIAESPRPMPLQRMFEHAAAPRDPGGRSSVTTTRPPPASVVEHHEYTEVSFGELSVQRDAEPSETAAPADEPTAAGAPETTATVTAVAPQTATGGATPAGGNIDELVNRLYDPLAARLRSELWLDRERAGVLMDLR
ncbi:hypothetical protein AU195_14185 [Mycobacterium sp. IS-1496]|uniref:hypothetical protein n=1 Tax=Mycobacterium sp. IS-1496 TaxID=1772284 RepID=UPI0007416674|nr:hypothetical protein [Mycobacterium sp. IS-1496]KUI26120.1 hypothetical protein AU195_14185 [Mycobacterium sp. IS-1496]